MKTNRGQGGEVSAHTSEASVAHVPGKDTLTSQRQLMPAASGAPSTMRRLQLKSAGSAARLSGQSFIDSICSGAVQRREAGEASTDQIHQAAAAGIQGNGGTLPHLDRIQGSFGDQHDLSGVVAHVGGATEDACASMGASAYATGNHVAFAQSPDLHTAAHEATHVVQQQRGIQLYGGVGQAGDEHERQADAVADRVVAGQSAADLLGSPASSSSGPIVQQKKGKVTHKGKAGLGNVKARKNDLDPNDSTNTNYSLEYAGTDADQAHWLQFVNFTMYAEVKGSGKVYYTGSVDTTSGNKPFSDDKGTNWSVDSGSSSDPYYEGAGSNERTPNKSTKIFDMPGGATIEPFAEDLIANQAPKATRVTFIAAFDTYLVVDNQAIYHVRWSATTKYDPKKKTSKPIEYKTASGGAVKGLPDDLKNVLDTQYSGNTIE